VTGIAFATFLLAVMLFTQRTTLSFFGVDTLATHFVANGQRVCDLLGTPLKLEQLYQRILLYENALTLAIYSRRMI
jgi:hypothetical protein